ncbi:cytochrome P450 [Biscogniauxia mediterranea]|nr:cytochrome P450 [Biscogniauxia mediterranea]
MSTSFPQYFSRSPWNMPVTGPTLRYGKWLSTINFLLRGSRTVLESYQEHSDTPFAVPSITEYQVLVSKREHIEEFSKCSTSVLSFEAAMKDRLNHKQIMLGFEHNDVDPHNSIPIHVLKVLLRKNLDTLSPVIQQGVKESLDCHLRNLPQHEGTWTVSIFSLAKAIAGRVNNQILFGDELARNEDFEKASLRYGWDGAITMEICRLLPRFLTGIVGTFLMARSGAMKAVGWHITKLVDERLVAHANGTGQKFIDCTQFVIKTSRTERQRSPARLVQQMVALQFASAHQLPMALAWAITMLCTHTEYVELLREEIQAAEQHAESYHTKDLRLLDSFLRESSRLNPLDSLSIQRKALKSFTFLNGSHVPEGNLVAVPQQAIMCDPKNYDDADTFDPLRFYAPQESNAPTTRYTDVNWKYPFWGSPAHPCPGRWYAADLMKHVVVHLLKNYDFELVKPKAPKALEWTTAIAPSFTTRIKLRVREDPHLPRASDV